MPFDRTHRTHSTPRAKRAWLSASLCLLVPAIAGAQAATGAASPHAQVARAVTEIEALDAMRSTLARTFAAGGVAATDSTFAQVCKPVKAQSMKVAREQGWMIAQLAERNRNADNTLDAGARRAFAAMRRDPALMGQWERTTLKGATGLRYYRRVTVESSCLACHGAKDARPDFVVKGYPADKAYGFSAGDLRGLYSVFIPDSTSRK
jgi:hypothetical protein